MPFIYARWVIAASLACTTLASLAQSQDAQPASSVLDAQMRNTQEPSKRLLHRMYGAQRPFEDKSPAEIAKLLNYAVFNHCSIDLPHTGRQDITELFDVPHVLWRLFVCVEGLVGRLRIRTRYANLYNLPSRAITPWWKPKPSLAYGRCTIRLFGAYFSRRLGDKPLSLEEVRFMLTPETIKKYVNTGGEGGRASARCQGRRSVRQIAFQLSQHGSDSYVTAEAGVPVGQNVKVPLVMPLRMSGTKVVAGKSARRASRRRAAFLLMDPGPRSIAKDGTTMCPICFTSSAATNLTTGRSILSG